MIKVEELKNKKKLLLQACCAPCSSYSLEYLSKYFDITIYYYNPNIYPSNEYDKRLDEVKRLVKEMNMNINVLDDGLLENDFISMAKGLENEPEGGKRCFKCYELRLSKTALKAKELGFDCFSTTLSISPYKNSNKLNEIGEKIEKENKIEYVYLNLKKNDGYKKSIEYSKKYNLYRQDYCGCVYSFNEMRLKRSL